MHLYKDKDVYNYKMQSKDLFGPQTILLLDVLCKTVVKCF